MPRLPVRPYLEGQCTDTVKAALWKEFHPDTTYRHLASYPWTA